MKIGLFLILIFQSLNLFASSFQLVDEDLGNILVTLLEQPKSKNEVASREDCEFDNSGNNLTKLYLCKIYLQEIYVTDDIDTYVAYIKQLLLYKISPVKISEYSKVLSAEYDEVNSKLYYRVAESMYRHGDYDHAIEYLKKIDDTLDDESVYKALLIYGLIYFEKNNYKKSKYFLKRIEKSSGVYKYAQYNLALINMKSSWWAEAEENLVNAINSIDVLTVSKTDEELLDKMYLTLGYSKINRKNFRDAKSSFEKISINSALQSRGLLGVAMSEIGMGNLSKAAPILKHIIKNSSNDEYLDALVTLPQVYHHANNIKLTVDYYQSALERLREYQRDVDKESNKYDYHKINSLWDRNNINKRITVIEQLKNQFVLTMKQRDHIDNIEKQLKSEISKYLKSINQQTSKKIDEYIKQVKYSMAVIYDEAVASND